MLRAAVLVGLALAGLVATIEPSQAYWVRRYYGPVVVQRYYRPYYRPYYYAPRVVVVPRPVYVAPYGYYR